MCIAHWICDWWWCCVCWANTRMTQKHTHAYTHRNASPAISSLPFLIPPPPSSRVLNLLCINYDIGNKGKCLTGRNCKWARIDWAVSPTNWLQSSAANNEKELKLGRGVKHCSTWGRWDSRRRRSGKEEVKDVITCGKIKNYNDCADTLFECFFTNLHYVQCTPASLSLCVWQCTITTHNMPFIPW